MKNLKQKNTPVKDVKKPLTACAQTAKKTTLKPLRSTTENPDDDIDREVFDLLESESEKGALEEAKRHFEKERDGSRELRFTAEDALEEPDFDDWYF